MFMIDRQRLIEGLTRLREKLCLYHPHPQCDCKYGARGPRPGEHNQFAEQTGCPELREAIALFEAMTDEQFDELVSFVPKAVVLPEIPPRIRR